MHRWTVLIAAHASAATLALLLGAVVIRMPRKGSPVHRRVGKVWFAAMYFTALSSFGIKELTPGHFSWIHGLSLWTLVSLTIALWAARTGRRQQHQAWVIGSYCGLLGAGMAAMAFPVRLAPQLLVHRPLVFAAAVVAIAGVTWAVVQLAKRPHRKLSDGGVAIATAASDRFAA